MILAIASPGTNEHNSVNCKFRLLDGKIRHMHLSRALHDRAILDGDMRNCAIFILVFCNF